MSNLKQKVALVTGGSSGIGQATSLALANAGAFVVINYASNASRADQLVNEIGVERAFAMQADAGSVQGAEDMVRATMDRFGRLDVLVLCAGTSPMRRLADTSEADFDQAIQLNVKGPYFVAQKAAAVMGTGSRIIFISSSLNSFSSVSGENLLYCTCKGAIEQMTRLMSKDLATKQINVNAVAPGPVDNDHFRRGKSDELMERITESIPLGRLSQAGDIADVIAFLSGDGARWITGQVIEVNGGMT